MLQAAASPPIIDSLLAARIEASLALLRDALQRHSRLVYASSLGPEAMVLTDLICLQLPAIDIITIDTGRLPEETLLLIERLERRYARRIRIYYPDTQAVERYVRAHGVNGFFNGLAERHRCCDIRKLEPFRRAIAGYPAWITGLRSEQSPLRAATQSLEYDAQFGLQKISPLLPWSEREVWTYIRAKQLYYNPLHDRGLASIGCAPCTRAIEPGQDQRAGRWWWEQESSRECGLHPRVPHSPGDGRRIG
jgi:phosphoadenosine phosphosulfate reductase